MTTVATAGSAPVPSSAQDAPKSRMAVNKIVVVVTFFAMLALNLRQQIMLSNAMRLRRDGSAGTIQRYGYGAGLDEADLIIRRSYEQSYAHILPCDDDAPSGKACMKKTLDYFIGGKGGDGQRTIGSKISFARGAARRTAQIEPDGDGANSTVPTIPWWFQTLLRDTVQGNGAFGGWHNFSTTAPLLNFCSIEKVATTEWRKVFCKLNADDCQPDPVKLCGKKKCAWQTKKGMPAKGVPRAVFLRDPLERLLSGYIDKCHKGLVRRREGHCEPNAVFNPAPGMASEKGRPYPLLLEHLDGYEKQMFAAYVDVLPLKWNTHFVPQAIMCDLHRTIGRYDFVGNMGRNFMPDLERMANRYGGPLPAVLNDTFGYMKHVSSGKENYGKDENSHATHAPAKVQQFYTPHAVRRGLELLSIDYVTLGLEVPEWARQMLKDDRR